MIYMDNASTTVPSEKALTGFYEGVKHFANPSSLYGLGMETEKLIKKSRETVAKAMGVPAKNVWFTSGGTESDNTAVIGAAKAYSKFGKHIITTKIEHPAVLEPFKMLENEGFEVSYLNAYENGAIDPEDLKGLLRDDTILVSVMLVNNETGVIQPVDKLKPIMKEYSPKALLHTDAVQGFGKIKFDPIRAGVDLMSVSGHKVHSVKGVGALYAGKKIHPYIVGGGQQDGMRSGTENTEGILAFAGAAEDIDPVKTMEHVTKIRNHMKSRFEKEINNIRINGADDINSGSVLNVSFLGIRSEILLHYLESEGIYVSTGSACSTHKKQKSYVLEAMGRTHDEIDGAIRFSFSTYNTIEEADIVADAVKKYVDEIRKYTRK